METKRKTDQISELSQEALSNVTGGDFAEGFASGASAGLGGGCTICAESPRARMSSPPDKIRLRSKELSMNAGNAFLKASVTFCRRLLNQLGPSGNGFLREPLYRRGQLIHIKRTFAPTTRPQTLQISSSKLEHVR